MTFILSEDEALKAWLRDYVRVSDATDGSRPVPVYFGMPEKELRAMTYPLILLELVNIREATERVHRGMRRGLYTPEGAPELADNERLVGGLPQPYDLIYQITTLARHPRHDRQMLAALHVGPLEVRGAGLAVDDDMTVRRMDRIDFQKRDTVDENSKRVYRNVFTVAVSAELFPQQIGAIRRTVDYVVVNPSDVDRTVPDELVGVEVHYP